MDYGFTEYQTAIRDLAREIAEKEIRPIAAEYDREAKFPWPVVKVLAETDLFRVYIEDEYGGISDASPIMNMVIVTEELSKACGGVALSFAGTALGTLPIILSGSEEQKKRWLPDIAAGGKLAAFALTEPQAGSDAGAVRTTAIRDGDHYVINGSKIFISNGQIADLFIVVVKTDPKADPPHRGVSLILVEGDAPGFVRGRKLDKLGFRGQDTSELFFEDCRVPVANLLGREGAGFKMLMDKLQQERLVTAVGAITSARRCLEDTIEYTRNRKAFGQPVASFQNTQFKLAEMMTEVEVGQAFVDRLLAAHVRGEELVTEVSMAKWWVTELLKRVSSQCLQLHGGYGFMMEFPVATDYADAAVQSIYAGTNEIMKVIIARRMGLDTRE